METNQAAQVVTTMFSQDAFSQWLGIELLEIREGYSRIKMTIRKEMVNGLGIAHGGIAFSLADSNNISVALDVSISFMKAVQVSDELVAEARELHNGRSTGVYLITVTNQRQEQVALFKGTCFRTGKKLHL
jgi:acyl-CoA thioesterase